MSRQFGSLGFAERCIGNLGEANGTQKMVKGGRTKTSDGILTHQDTADSHIGRAGTHAPSDGITSAIIERSEDKFGALVFGGLGQYCNSEARYTERMQCDAGVVQIPQNLHSKGIQHGMTPQQGSIDTQSIARGWCEATLDGRGGGN